MVVINEWLPNPKGTDTKSEWIELRNSGNLPADLSGWRITADGKKLFALKGVISGGAHIVLPRSETKITLKNTDGKLALYDASGHLADQTSFLGSAPEGESVNRMPNSNSIFFGKPTPGTLNTLTPSGGFIRENTYPFGIPLGPRIHTAPQFTGYLIGTALALAVAVVFILKSHEDLSHLFFGRD